TTDGHRVFAQVNLKDDYPTARQYYKQLRAKVHSDHLQVLGTGNVAIGSDFDKYLESDLQRAEVVSLVIIVPLLLIVFATVISILLPLGVGGLAEIGRASCRERVEIWGVGRVVIEMNVRVVVRRDVD